MMIPGAKGLKSDEGLLAGGFLNLGPAKNMMNITDKTGRLVAIKNVTDDNDLMIISATLFVWMFLQPLQNV